MQRGAFCGLQNGRAHDDTRDPVDGWGGDTPPHTPLHFDARHSVPRSGEGGRPKYFCLELPLHVHSVMSPIHLFTAKVGVGKISASISYHLFWSAVQYSDLLRLSRNINQFVNVCHFSRVIAQAELNLISYSSDSCPQNMHSKWTENRSSQTFNFSSIHSSILV